jgi:hypothetical protein
MGDFSLVVIRCVRRFIVRWHVYTDVVTADFLEVRIAKRVKLYGQVILEPIAHAIHLTADCFPTKVLDDESKAITTCFLAPPFTPRIRKGTVRQGLPRFQALLLTVQDTEVELRTETISDKLLVAIPRSSVSHVFRWRQAQGIMTELRSIMW